MNIALLVLDVQKDFIGEQARLPVAKHQVEPMLESINTIIKKVSSKGISVVYIGNEFEPKQFISNIFRRNSALKGREGAELDERLLKVNDVYFPKNKGDAFSNPELIAYLNSNGIKEIIIVGLFTEGCVSATALGSIHHHFNTTVIKDAVASSSDKKRLQSLNKLSSKGVSVLNSEQLFEMLSNVK
ncbi:cysteine hydrolase [Aciduricibacillus chroicocephali]|uniref:Cysteine hydrolase n=1 Tax=Aciduricibacillus chroicocephali TaxID=3054939 RepID=A0ABY9KVQ7_9BACI|nr:cysteine hydrolase [Bacillaceae bacterium 44XB]